LVLLPQENIPLATFGVSFTIPFTRKVITLSVDRRDRLQQITNQEANALLVPGHCLYIAVTTK